VPAADPETRDRLREIAVAVFDSLDPDDPLVSTYRRRLAAALY
jgi:thioredoxin-like negative regulator of GroEL